MMLVDGDDVFTAELLAALAEPLCEDCVALLPTDRLVFWIGGPPRCEAHR